MSSQQLRSSGDDVGSETAPSAERTGLEALEGVGTRPISIVAPRRVGETELGVYPLGLGTAAFGSGIDDEAALDLLDRFAAHGGTLVDTAPQHASGHAEEVVGRWLRSRGLRDRMIVSVKAGRGAEHPGHGPVNLVRAVEASLTRLGTDHIDLLYLDGEDPGVGLGQTLETVDWLRQAGKVRYLGACDVTADRLLEARILSAAGLPRIEVLQCAYSVARREAFTGDLRIAASAQGLALTPYASLASGPLAARYGTPDEAVSRGVVARAASSLYPRHHRLLAALDRIARELDTSVLAVAFAWTQAQRGVVAPVANPRTAAQVDDLLQSAAVRLTRAHVLELDRA